MFITMSLPCIHDYHQLHTCAHHLVTVFNVFHCQIPVMEGSTTFVAWIFVAPPAMCYVSVFQQIVLITKGIATNITLGYFFIITSGLERQDSLMCLLHICDVLNSFEQYMHINPLSTPQWCSCNSDKLAQIFLHESHLCFLLKCL